MGVACTRMIEVSAGTVARPGGPAGQPAGARPARRRRAGLVLRPLPGTSPLHRLRAEAKLAALAAITLAALVIPGWPLAAALAVLFAAGAAAARLPRTVLPRLPLWVAAFLLLGVLIAAFGGGLGPYAEFVLIAGLFFALTLLVIWTTRVEELPGAFARLAWPLRKAGAPVDEWAHTLALTVRTLPLLGHEGRLLIAARRLRAAPRAAGWRARTAVRGRELTDLVIAIVAAAARRASDLGRAATQRGGMRPAE
jgi:energy-coupling factor transporter transmembrane protein EcfT